MREVRSEFKKAISTIDDLVMHYTEGDFLCTED